MFKPVRNAWWLIFLGLATACATLTAPGTPASPLVSPVAADQVLVRYHRSGGIGGFDELWIIYGDGRVEHSGRGSGTRTQLAPDQIAALSGLLRSAEVLALNESYVPPETCCDRFTHELTITIDGRTKTVRTLDAAPDEPPALTNLLRLLNSLLK